MALLIRSSMEKRFLRKITLMFGTMAMLAVNAGLQNEGTMLFMGSLITVSQYFKQQRRCAMLGGARDCAGAGAFTPVVLL